MGAWIEHYAYQLKLFTEFACIYIRNLEQRSKYERVSVAQFSLAARVTAALDKKTDRSTKL